MTDTTISNVPGVTPASPARLDKITDLAKAPEKVEPASAQARVEASRACVRGELLAIAHPPPRASSGLFDTLTGMVKEVPGVGLVLATAKHWWSEHGDTARSASGAAQAFVSPMARKHPASMLGVAAAIGAGLVLLRWRRLLLRPKFLYGALSLVATQALRSGAASSWLALAISALGSKRSRS